MQAPTRARRGLALAVGLLALLVLAGGARATAMLREGVEEKRIAAELEASVHKGMKCTECHDEAAIGAAGKIADRPGAAACAKCHGDEAAELAGGVHHRSRLPALAAMRTGCVACHPQPHRIRPVREDRAPREACRSCHADNGLVSRVTSSKATGGSFLSSVHGRKYVLGHAKAPDCASCHGAHRVVSLVDDGTAGAMARRVESCAQCHKGATPSFAASVSHESVTWRHRPVSLIVVVLYTLLIAGTTCFFGGMIALETGSRIVRIALGRPVPIADHEDAERFAVQQRLQHAGIVASFLVLVFTGLPLLAAGVANDPSKLTILGGVENAARLHRGAGVVMLLATVWHLVWLVWRWRCGRLATTMTPGRCDLRELLAELKMMALLTDDVPVREGKYGWVEKLEYWAFAWGVGVMGVTGLLLWFPVVAVRWLPPGALPVVQLIHGYEAILATVSVFLWHLYQVHLKPGIWPMNWTWLTGRAR